MGQASPTAVVLKEVAVWKGSVLCTACLSSNVDDLSKWGRKPRGMAVSVCASCEHILEAHPSYSQCALSICIKNIWDLDSCEIPQTNEKLHANMIFLIAELSSAFTYQAFLSLVEKSSTQCIHEGSVQDLYSSVWKPVLKSLNLFNKSVEQSGFCGIIAADKKESNPLSGELDLRIGFTLNLHSVLQNLVSTWLKNLTKGCYSARYLWTAVSEQCVHI